MSAVRIWILAVALGSFAAGMVLGVSLPEMLAADRAPESPEQLRVREMALRYGLSAAQEHSLRLVLVNDRLQEFEILKEADWNGLPPSIRNRLLETRRTTDQRIRVLLDDRQLALYERDSKPDGIPPENK